MGYCSQTGPPGFIVGEVRLACNFLRGEAIHNLVFIKRAVRVALVDDKHIALFGSVREEHVNVVSVHTLRATNIAVVIVHLGFPLRAVCVLTTAHTSFGVLNADVVTINTAVFHLVISGGFLRFGRLGRGGVYRLRYACEVSVVLAVIGELTARVRAFIVRRISLDNLMLAVNVKFTLVYRVSLIGTGFFPLIAYADTRTQGGFFGGVLVDVVTVIAERL